MTARNRAPRRTVLDINRVISARDGVCYHHDLDCGHIEIRKRPTPTKTMGCLDCAEDLATTLSIRRFLEKPSPWDEPDASVDVRAARIQADLAGSLGVPLEAISINRTQTGAIAGAMIWLHEAALTTFIERVVKRSDPM